VATNALLVAPALAEPGTPA